MSISMMLYNKATGEVRNIPVSFQRVFNERWLPLAEKLGLETIPLYDGALMTRSGETDVIIRDLLQLRRYLFQHKEEPDAEYMLGAIKRLISWLIRIENNPDLEGSFG